MDLGNKRLVIVSNRLPVAVYEDELKRWRVKASPGGLVTALGPIIRKNNGIWIGWAGCNDSAPVAELIRQYNETENFELVPVLLGEKDIARYYRGFSNKTIWPLFHDLLGKFSFDYDNWRTYRDVNRRFAEKTADVVDRGNIIWVHDYQLLFVGQYLRRIGLTDCLNFFLHIPFPPYDIFRCLPRNNDILRAMLAYDHIGFQTPMDRRNFIGCIKWLIPEATRISHGRQTVIRYEGRHVQAGYYPISIDFRQFTDLARTDEAAEAAWYLRENIKADKIVLGLDRLDYTKGIPLRLLAFERLLEKYPDTIGRMSLLQVVIPSRGKVSEYQDLKSELDGLAGRINARFSREGWLPVHYQFRELDPIQLVGHYRAADLALITPLRDGMNLVAKEYCAGNIDNDGVLILSEFAGAARQLCKGALIVNPFDIESTADAVYMAGKMPREERVRRMKLLRSEVKRNDVTRWVGWFFEAETGRKSRGRNEAELFVA